MTKAEKLDREISKYKVYVSENKQHEANRSYDKIEGYVINAIYQESGAYYYQSYTTQEYVIQDMRIELLNAINTYDSSRGVKFITFFTNIMKRYRINTFRNIENIHSKIPAFYPESKTRNVLSYSVDREYIGQDSKDTILDGMADIKSQHTEDKINCIEALNNVSNLDSLDKLILATIISEDSAINVIKEGKPHNLNREYLMDTFNINKSTLQSKLNKYNKMNLVECLLKDVYRGIEDLPKVSTLDNLVDQSIDLDDMINAIAV
jgi:hypothetical protein